MDRQQEESNLEPTFVGVWREIGAKRKIDWYFPPDGKTWKYDPDDRILRISHVNMRDDIYSVRWLTAESAMLMDIVDHRVTLLQR